MRRRKERELAVKDAQGSVVPEEQAAPVDIAAKKTHTDTPGVLAQHKEFIQEAEILAKRERLFTKTIEGVEKMKPENITENDGVRFSQEALLDLLKECLFTVEMAKEYNAILAEKALGQE